MKKFINYFREFHKNYFTLSLYAMVLLFIALLTAFNYTLDFEDAYIDHYYGKAIRILFYFLLHAFAYYGVIVLIWIKQRDKLKLNRQFWIMSLLGLLILGNDRAIFPFISKLILGDAPFATYRFFYKVLFNSYGLVVIGVALFMVKLSFDRKSGDGLYGLRFKKVDFRPYWIMLFIMLPIIYFATYLPDIQAYYPTCKRAGTVRFAHYYNLKQWIGVLIYEIVYFLDFFNTELFFRGFLVIGLSKILGKNAVLPMVATYAVLHFGKPMGECISSVFGGYILGVIALYSRNIWGGIFLHGGIAMFMEVFSSVRH